MPLHWPGLWTAQPWQFQSNWVFSTLQIRLSQGPQELRSAHKKITELIRGGQLEDARALFDTLSQRNTVTWNSMLSGDSGSGGSTRFKRNVVTWNSMIMSYVKAGDMASARELFNQTEVRDTISWNTMISGYAHVSDMEAATELFSKMGILDALSWNSIVFGFAQAGKMELAL
ncbi:hypothetical protein Salat_0863900, partial [Sesamum alatum]